jgi:hypothetical protein
MISRQWHPGRPRIDATIRDLIREMATDGWGAPRIHGELMKLGFEVSEATVSQYIPRLPSDPDQLRWDSSRPWVSNPVAPLTEVHGRTVSQSDGLAAAGEHCSIM